MPGAAFHQPTGQCQTEPPSPRDVVTAVLTEADRLPALQRRSAAAPRITLPICRTKRAPESVAASVKEYVGGSGRTAASDAADCVKQLPGRLRVCQPSRIVDGK